MINDKIDTGFEIVKPISKDPGCCVFLANDKDQAKYAVKMFHVGDKHIEIETEAAKRLNHDNIVKYKNSVQVDKYVLLVFEWADGGDLYTVFDRRGHKPMPEKEAWNIMRQLMSAIKHCHENGVIHMDIKLDNIIYNEKQGIVKLVDFGLSVFFVPGTGEFKTSRRVGSEEYCPPEIIDNRYTSFSGDKVDVWCAGIVLYTLLVALFPFDVKERRQAIKQGLHPIPVLHKIKNPKCRNLVMRMLDTDPSTRISVDDILQHPWMLEVQK